MKFNYIKKLITAGTAAAIFISGCNAGSTGSANTKNTNLANAKIASMNDSTDTEDFSNTDSRSSVTQNEENIQLGLMGHYFAKDKFVDHLFQIHHKSNQFGISKNMYTLLKDIHADEQTQERRDVTVKSIYWNGYIKFDTDITTQLVFGINGTAKQLPYVQIYINNKPLEKPFQFVAGRYYKLKITIRNEKDLTSLLGKFTLKLVYGNNRNEYKIVPDKNLFGPNSKFAMTKGIQGYADDSDNKDDVIKSNALSGFVVVPEGEHIVYKAWMPSYYGKLQKLYSNADDSSDTTLGHAASPWKDQEKIDSLSKPAYSLGISKDAANPVVAAYPIIKPLISKVSVTVQETLTHGFSNTTTDGTGSSLTNTKVHEVSNNNSFTVDPNAGLSKEGLNVGLHVTYNHTWGSSDTSTSGSEASSSFSLSAESNTSTTINTGEAAKLVINTRFKNIGTASISGMLPQLNIGTLSKSNDSQAINSITSIFTNTSQKIENILPWQTFPNDGSAYVYSTKDAFGGSDLVLNVLQYESITSGDPIVVSMPQLSTITDSNKQDINWQNTINTIEKNTALFILRTPRADIERRVFGLDSDLETANLQRAQYPELTLRDAFYVAFKLIPPNMKDRSWKYDPKFNINNLQAKYHFESLEIIGDENAYSNIPQVANSEKIESNIIDTYKIRAGMQFILSPTGWVINEEHNNAKSYATLQHGFYRNEAAEIEGKGYLFNADGELVTNPGLNELQKDYQSTKKTYFVENNPEHTLSMGLKTIEKDLYLFGSDYAMLHDYLYHNNGIIYYFGTDGKALKSTDMTINGEEYHFDDNGKGTLKPKLIPRGNITLVTNSNDNTGYILSIRPSDKPFALPYLMLSREQPSKKIPDGTTNIRIILWASTQITIGLPGAHPIPTGTEQRLNVTIPDSESKSICVYTSGDYKFVDGGC